MALNDDDFVEQIRTRAVPPRMLYKYTMAETVRIILSNGTLRYQSPLNYNDPFDNQWDPFWPAQNKGMEERQRLLLDSALRSPYSWPAGMKQEMRSALRAEIYRIESLPINRQAAARSEFIRQSVTNRGMSTAARDLIIDMRRRMRVLCLCETEFSILMWSHYAAQHQGIVLGFDTATFEQKIKRPLEKVAYQDVIPNLIDEDLYARSMIFGMDLPWFKGEGKEGTALTKFKDWEYEREWRFVWIEKKGTPGNHLDFKFPKDALTELIFGCRTPLEHRDEIVRLAQIANPEIEIFSMSMSPDRFELIKSLVN